MPRTNKRRLLERAAKIGVSYARFSTDRQASVDQQHATNDDVAEEEGIRIVAPFGDEAKSRSIDDRDGLLEMFEYLEAHPEVGFIVVNELERMTAGIMQRARVIELCRRLQITILTEDVGAIDPFDEEKMHMADKRSVESEGELIRARRRVKRHMKALAHEPGKFIMRPCFGMRVVPVGPRGVQPIEELQAELGEVAEGRTIRGGPWELHPTEYPWLVRIYALADAGMKDAQIARYLVDRGVRTKLGKLHWATCTVKQILTNDFYIGVYEYGKTETKRDGQHKYQEPRPDVHPNRVTRSSPLGEMIDEDLWRRVNSRRQARSESGDARYLQTGRRSAPPQPFDDRIFCGRCGYKMYGQFDVPRKKYVDETPPFRYTCKKSSAPSRARKEGFADPCTTSQSITDRQLLAALAGFGADTRFIPLDPRRHDLDHLIAQKQAAIEADKAETRFNRTKDLHKEGLATLEEVRAEKSAWDVAVAKAEELRHPEAAPVTVPKYLTFVDWNNVAMVLAHESLPVADKHAILGASGIHRFYVDFPVVQPQFLDR